MTTSRKPVDHTNIKPGSDPTKLVNDLYAFGRTYPRNAPPRPRLDPAVNDAEARRGRKVSRNDPFNENTNQDASNFHSPNYSNDSAGWVRGCKSGEPQMHSESGEHKPGFDKNQSYRHADGGNRRGERDTKHFESDRNQTADKFPVHVGRHGRTHGR
ncbi:MAG: hypothetical protein WCB70_10570 [Xanthobacteraceae bacterium]